MNTISTISADEINFDNVFHVCPLIDEDWECTWFWVKETLNWAIRFVHKSQEMATQIKDTLIAELLAA